MPLPLHPDRCPEDPGEIAEQYCLGRLSEEDTKAFEEHYLVCQRCIGELEHINGFIEAIRSADIRPILLPKPQLVSSDAPVEEATRLRALSGQGTEILARTKAYRQFISGLLSARESRVAAVDSPEVEAAYGRLLNLLAKTMEALDPVRLQALGLLDAIEDEMFTLSQASGE